MQVGKEYESTNLRKVSFSGGKSGLVPLKFRARPPVPRTWLFPFVEGTLLGVKGKPKGTEPLAWDPVVPAAATALRLSGENRALRDLRHGPEPPPGLTPHGKGGELG